MNAEQKTEWVWVPRVPTDEMLSRGAVALKHSESNDSGAEAAYAAMIAAAAMAAPAVTIPPTHGVVEFDGTDREVLREFIRICREHKPVGPWPGERVCKAIERAMDNEKPFRFIAEADMAPEREPSMKDEDRALSGPRRRRAPPPAETSGAPRFFRKKPVVVEAVQYAFDNVTAFDDQVQDAVAEFMQQNIQISGDQIVIRTLEGEIFASPGDWIIRGVQGEFYPCKPEIFAATYEPALDYVKD